MKRRDFLKLTPAAAAAGFAVSSVRAAQPAGTARRTGSSFDPWVEIRRDHVEHNVREISRRVGGRPILAVIKNNGYGMGVDEAARVLEPLAPVAGFAVVKLQEAAALRDAGIRKPVLLMGPLDESGLEYAVAHDLTPMVYTPVGDMLDRLAARVGRPCPIHICVDTGIGRVGVPYRQAGDLIRDLARRPSVRIDGVMMTFAEDPSFDEEQKMRFLALTRELAAAGVTLGRRHACSSFGLFQHPDFFLDTVRPGMALYGVYSEQPFRSMGALDLQPALSLKARVAYVKRLDVGDSAGYNRAYRPTVPTWIATLPVGHADGLPRGLANTTRIRIGDRLYPIVASISASHTIVEIGRERTVDAGDEATLFDWQDGSRPEDVAASAGASVYDLLMHLNPLLPRVVV